MTLHRIDISQVLDIDEQHDATARRLPAASVGGIGGIGGIESRIIERDR